MGGGIYLIMPCLGWLPGHAALHSQSKSLPRARESGKRAMMTDTVTLLYSFYWLSF